MLFFSDVKPEKTKERSKQISSPKKKKTYKSSTRSKLKKIKIVRNLRLSIINPDQYTARLTWKPSHKKGLYIIARSDEPINNIRTLRSAKVLAVKSEKTHSFIDKKIPKGIHYYAIVLRKNITANKVYLIRHENYTVIPLIATDDYIAIGKDTLKQKKKSKARRQLYREEPAVNSIVAKVVYNAGTNDKPYVRLSWSKNIRDVDSYLIYRSPYIINTIEALKNAIRIKEVSSSVNFIHDVDITTTEKYYYAVTAQINNAEIKVLGSGRNYTVDPVSLRSTYLPITPFISASKTKGNSIQLSWRDIPEDQQAGHLFYVLYRSQQPILSLSDLSVAVKVATFGFNQLGFLDTNVPPGVYYYALVTQSSLGSQSHTFLGNSNVTVTGIFIGDYFKGNQIPLDFSTVEGDATTEKRYFAEFKAEESQKGVFLSWGYFLDKSDIMDIYSSVLIYRFNNKPQVQQDLERGLLVDKVPLNTQEYLDSVLEEENYYYALFLHGTGQRISPHQFIIGYNLIGPVHTSYRKSHFKKPSLERDKHIPYISVPKRSQKSSSVSQIGREINSKPKVTSKNLSVSIVPQPTLTLEKEATVSTPKKREIYSPNNNPNITLEKEKVKDYPLPNINKATNQKEKRLLKKLNSILKKTYFQRDYREALEQLSDFLNLNISQFARGTALFYIGLSYYHSGKYKKSIDYFLHPAVKQFYKTRSKFWYARALESINV